MVGTDFLSVNVKCSLRVQQWQRRQVNFSLNPFFLFLSSTQQLTPAP